MSSASPESAIIVAALFATAGTMKRVWVNFDRKMWTMDSAASGRPPGLKSRMSAPPSGS